MVKAVPTTLGLKTYRRLAASAGPLFSYLLKRRTLQGKEDPKRVREKQGFASAERPSGPLVWLHGASVGESLSMLPLLKSLTAIRPDLHFLVTTGTLTSAELMAERLPASACHQFAPLDHPDYWNRFYAHWQPDLAVIIESELWPNMILGGRQHEVPLVLANARLSEKSANGWSRVGHSIKHLLNCFELVLAQERRSAERLQALGASAVETPGNLKFDAPPLETNSAALDTLLEQIGGRPCWVAASTHDGEEALVGRVHKQLQQQFPDLLTILAPRHPARGADIVRGLQKQGLTVACRSQNEPITGQSDVYLADTLGEMGLVFRLAPIAFIGGSFVEVGGHNPLEAARLDTAVLFGPQMFNFEDAATMLVDADAAKQAASETALQALLSEWLAAPAETSAKATRGREAVAQSKGVAARIAQKLLPFLPEPAQTKAERDA